MPVTIQQWIKRQTYAAVEAGRGEWIETPETIYGAPIYRVADGPVTLMFYEQGLTYDDPPSKLECRYDQVERFCGLPLRQLIPQQGDLLPRSGRTRLLTISLERFGSQPPLALRLSLVVHNIVVSFLPRVVHELARAEHA